LFHISSDYIFIPLGCRTLVGIFYSDFIYHKFMSVSIPSRYTDKGSLIPLFSTVLAFQRPPFLSNYSK